MLPRVIAYTDFAEPALGAGSYAPSSGALEMGFTTFATSTGANTLTGAFNESGAATSPVFSHRSASGTTIFETVDLSEWTNVTFSMDVAVSNTTYEFGDLLRINLTDGHETIPLFYTKSSSDLNDAAGGGFMNFIVPIPESWTSATLMIQSASNSTTGAERYDFDNIIFRGLMPIPEPSALTLLMLGGMGVVIGVIRQGAR